MWDTMNSNIRSYLIDRRKKFQVTSDEGVKIQRQVWGAINEVLIAAAPEMKAIIDTWRLVEALQGAVRPVIGLKVIECLRSEIIK